MIIFMLCLSVRFVEYFLIETDKTSIGENVLHKVIGIILLALALKKINLTWRDIGFQRDGFVSGILKGLLLGSICFAVSFGLELGILALQGNSAHLEIYISSFFFVNRLSNKKYGFCFLSVMRTIQYHQCMDGGGRFSRSVHKNTFRNKAIYASELYCRIFVWCLAHCNAHQKLHKLFPLQLCL